MSESQDGNIVRRRGTSLREKFTWKRDNARTTQSLKFRPNDVKSGKKPPFVSANSTPNLQGTMGTSFNLFADGSVKIHKVLDTPDTNLFMKLLQYTKALKTWETHNLVLNDNSIISATPTGVFVSPIPYSSILQLLPVELKKESVIYCVKVFTNTITILLHASNAHQRDRWLHSIRWKMDVHESCSKLLLAENPDVLLEDFKQTGACERSTKEGNREKLEKELVKLTLECRLDVDDTHKILLGIVSSLLAKKAKIMNEISHEALIMALGPLLEKQQPSQEICNFFTKHCRQCPRSIHVIETFTPIVQHVLKCTVDFGKATWRRTFVKEYIQALRSQNNGIEAVRAFVHTMHGTLSECPHKRILSNLISVCNSAIYQCVSTGKPNKKPANPAKHRRSRAGLPLKTTEKGKNTVLNNCNGNIHPIDPKNMKNANQDIPVQKKQLNDMEEESKILNTDVQQKGDPNLKETYLQSNKHASMMYEEDPPGLTATQLETMSTFVEVLKEISKISDWCSGLADILQPLPFPNEAMNNIQFTRLMYPVIEQLANDPRGSVVRCLLYSRGGKDGWLQVYSPDGFACEDDGKLFTKMMEALLKPEVQTGQLKKFLATMAERHLQVVVMLALRENAVMISVLQSMLEMGILTDEQSQLQVVSALRCTPVGREAYDQVKALLESLINCKGPTEFTLSPNSTDSDLETLLGTGGCKSLQSLTLSCTHVTSQSSALIAELRNLKHLNLWATNFDDQGLRVLCDSLDLQYLNLCETFVTDEGIQCLEAMPSLEELNLCSTDLQASTFQSLKERLPNLKDYSVAYTDAFGDV